MSTVTESPSAGEARPAQTRRGAQHARPVRSHALVTVTALAAAAGAIHAVAAVDHFDHYWLYGVFFVVLTYAQILWGIWVYRHPQDRRALVAGAVGSVAVSAVWFVSRTVGVPIGPDTWQPERIGAMDFMATLDQVVCAALVAVLVAPESRFATRLRWLAGGHVLRVGIMLCSASAFSLLLGSHDHR